MAELPTPTELADTGRAAFRAALDPAGTGAVNLNPGSRNDTAISVLTAVGMRLAAYVADRVAAGRRSSATDTDLDVLGRDLYGEERKPEAFATGVVRLARLGAGATLIPAGTRVATQATASQAAVVYEVLADQAATGTTVDVAVVAQESGVAANLTDPSQVSVLLDPLPDPTWTIDAAYMAAHPADFVFGGGAARETDDDYRDRLAQISPQAERQRGTLAAVLAGALRVPGVASATVVEPFDGTLLVYVGDSNFQCPVALATAVATELQSWRARGVPALIRAYAVSDVAVQATVYMARPLVNYSQDALYAAMVAQIIDYFDSRPQPDEYYTDAVSGAVFRAHPEVQHVALALPASSVQRPPDAGYGAIVALNRYRVTAADIVLQLADPLTT